MITISKNSVAMAGLFLAQISLPGVGCLALGNENEAPGPGNLASRIRQPVALALVDGGSRLLVANGRSGSISVLDPMARRVLAEHDVGRALADLARLPDGRHLLALDRADSSLLLLDRHDAAIRVIARHRVSPDPVRILVSRHGSCCAVASRWSRRLTLLALARPEAAEGHPSLGAARTIDLPFSPREMVELPVSEGAGLLVADAFGGKLALVDFRKGSLASVRALPAHNIRGLALAPDGKTAVIAYQTLNPLARSTFDDVHWGLLVNHQLRVLKLDAIRIPDADLLAGSRLFDLGDVGKGAADPSGLSFDSRGRLIVALGGVDEVAVTPRPGQPERRVAVGRRPTAIEPRPDGTIAYVADTFGDTISIVELEGGRRLAAISLGPAPELSLADRGERLFYQARLSHDGWMSCQSCHTDGHSNGLLSDTLGDGSYGAPKKIPSLLGVGSTGPWTWVGSMTRLEDQVRKSIRTTMLGSEAAAGDEHVEALAAFLRSLPPLSPALTGTRVEDAAVSRGRRVFEARECATCHAPPEYTAPERFDVGLADEVGNREFNPPSLLGLSRREPFLHDGRALSLDDLFGRHRHPRETIMTPGEIADLVAFLKTL
jgi:cytochrome c peroxidase